MRVPISWLKDYVDINLPVEELAEKLTIAGLEVSEIEYIGLEIGCLGKRRGKGRRHHHPDKAPQKMNLTSPIYIHPVSSCDEVLTRQRPVILSVFSITLNL